MCTDISSESAADIDVFGRRSALAQLRNLGVPVRSSLEIN